MTKETEAFVAGISVGIVITFLFFLCLLRLGAIK